MNGQISTHIFPIEDGKMSNVKKLRFAATITLDVSREIEISGAEWERIKACTPRDISSHIQSPLMDLIDWKDIDVTDFEVDEIDIIDDSQKVVESYTA